MQARLNANRGYNKQLSTQAGQVLSGLRYLTTRKGPLALPAFDVVGFLKSDDTAPRVDGQILLAPATIGPQRPGKNPTVEREPGIQCIGFTLRPQSEGTISITSDDPSAPLRIVPNYYATPDDRRTGVAVFRKMRDLLAAEPLVRHIDHETLPGPSLQDDEAIIEMALERGYCGYHAIGTCAMGPDQHDVVDSQLRVRGVDGLRIMDCSVLPAMVSGNLNGPMMAMAWLAADVIRDSA